MASTLLVVAVALVAFYRVWVHYMHDPWTRDGRIRADVVRLGVDVSGLVESLNVHDNDRIQKGEVLFTIDKQRYQLALEQAQTRVRQLEMARDRAREDYVRRKDLERSVSKEERDNARFAYQTAQVQVDNARIMVRRARLDLERAVIRAPVDGYVTNLLLRPGQYVSAGGSAMTLVDANSFYALGYFEETKLAHVHVGAPARLQLLSSDTPLHGRVVSIARGITDNSLSAQRDGLPAVNPSFDWVRLSQRIPVRIALDAVPSDILLSAGLTATVYLDGGRTDMPAWQRTFRHWWENIFDI